MIKGHGGNIYDLARECGCAPSDIVDMSSNVNPFGPPPGLLDYIKESLVHVTALPEVDAGQIRHAFADSYGVDPACVLAGNGSTQFIYSLPRALKSSRVMILGPTYADYADACRMNDVQYNTLTVNQAEAFVHDPALVSAAITTAGADTVFICNPNNPTGVLMPEGAIADLCLTHPEVFFIIDESYLGFVHDGQAVSLMRQNAPDNVIVLNSMSKLYKIPGLRIGFVFSARKVIDQITAFNLPWSVNSLSQAAVAWLMENRSVVSRFVEETTTMLDAEKTFLSGRIDAMSGIEVLPSTTSFMLAILSEEYRAEDICRYLARHRILIRNCENFSGLSSQYVRFSLKTHAENALMVNLMDDYFIGKEMK